MRGLWRAESATRVMRLAVVATTLNWLWAGHWLFAGVGLGAAVLTLAPALVVGDGAVRQIGDLCLATLAACHVVLGMAAGLYESSAVYDKLMHLIGLAALTGVIAAGISRHCDQRGLVPSTTSFAVVVLSLSLSLGTLWELFEFAVDRTGLFRAQRGLDDTMIDLAADALGALFAVGLFVAKRWATAPAFL